jgi:adenosylhomocysteine nucleosidase
MRARAPRTTIIVPRGAEAAAVRRAATSARVVEVPAGAPAASALPPFDDDETVIVLGLCGGLRRLHAHDVAIYARVADGARRSVLDRPLVDELTAVLPGALVVDACTAERVVTTVAARAALAQRFGADVVDMEGSHLAAALDARGVRYAMVRVVSDDATRALPPIGDAIDADGRVRPIAIALAFARAPSAAFAFVRDVRRALATLTDTARTIGRLDA